MQLARQIVVPRAAVILTAFAVSLIAAAARADEPRRTPANVMIETEFTSAVDYKDPFNETDLDVVFTTPSGKTLRVPAFWDGGKSSRVRYASPEIGLHTWRSECSDASNAGLHGVSGQIEVTPYRGDNPLYRHGALRVAADRRHFEQADGTPFFWLADTWWMGLCQRLHWPDEFKTLAADRRAKGFNVIQIAAGLYPDQGAFDPRGPNETGFPWEANYARIRPEYFDAADQRMAHIVESGMMPCIVGAWGYHLPWLGVERMKKHWRYVVARWGAWPVVWSVAGEGTMPFYQSQKENKAAESAFQKKGWSDIARYLRKLDPYHRLITIHEEASRMGVDDPSLIDFEMVSPGHDDRKGIPKEIRMIRASRAAWPIMPVIVGEANYEGIGETCFEEVQRLTIYSALLAGTAGHTYGANGIWQVNRKEQTFGRSASGINWGDRSWDDAMRLPGAAQVGLARRLYEQFHWQQFEPHPEWVKYATGAERDPMFGPYAAGVAGGERIVYVPTHEAVVNRNLELGKPYAAGWFDPVTGQSGQFGVAWADRDGNWTSSVPTADHDWVLTLRRERLARVPAISLHPDNPKYFLFRGRPLVLLAATEHYGSVINRAFDFERYLADAAEHHQTVTRTFLLFRESQGSRNPSSPCKPESPDYLAPYPRTGPGAAGDGEPRYDLDQWNPVYFDRLHRFLDRASQLGIVVELTLFSNAYGQGGWDEFNPLSPANNLQKVGTARWEDYLSLRNKALNDRQFAYVAKIIAETARYDNVYYEICNEPGGGFPGRATPAEIDAWQAEIARLVRDELSRRGRPHLVFGSQAFTYIPKFQQELDASFSGPTFDAVNVHPLPDTVLGGRTYMLGHFMSKELALREFAEFCRATQQRGKPAVHDEDNAASMYRDDVGWTIHRKRAWVAALSQTHYDYIDFSITVGSEAGTDQSRAQIRSWIGNLSQFIHAFDFIHAKPLPDLVAEKPQHTVAAALGKPGADYAIYLADDREATDPTAGQPIAGELSLRLPAGSYQVSFYSPVTGMASPANRLAGSNDPVHIRLPPFEQDIVVRLIRGE